MSCSRSIRSPDKDFLAGQGRALVPSAPLAPGGETRVGRRRQCRPLVAVEGTVSEEPLLPVLPAGHRGRWKKLERLEHKAKAICCICSVRTNTSSLRPLAKIRRPYGIWGGLRETERRQVACVAPPSATGTCRRKRRGDPARPSIHSSSGFACFSGNAEGVTEIGDSGKPVGERKRQRRCHRPSRRR